MRDTYSETACPHGLAAYCGSTHEQLFAQVFFQFLDGARQRDCSMCNRSAAGEVEFLCNCKKTTKVA